MTKRGSALILTLITLAVLAILGVVLLSVSLANTRQVKFQEMKMQAYYLARAGAASTADYIISNPDKLSGQDMINFVNNNLLNKTSTPQNMANGQFYVNVLGNINKLKITATGTVGNVSQTETLFVTQRMIFDRAVFANENIVLDSGAAVEDGDVEAGGTVSLHLANAYVDGEIVEYSDIRYPSIPFPNLPAYPESTPENLVPQNLAIANIDVDFFEYISPNKEVTFKSITLQPQGKITFKLYTEDVSFVVESMDLNGAIEVKRMIPGEEPVLRVYVKKQISFKGEVKSPPASLFFAVGDGITNDGYVFMQTGNAIFQGYIYAPTALVEIKANLNLFGAIVAKNADLSSGAVTYYDPSAPLISAADFGIPPMGFQLGTWGR